MWMFQWASPFGHVKKYGVASSMNGLLNKNYQVTIRESEFLTLCLLHL
jgi:hypothetical protein